MSIDLNDYITKSNISNEDLSKLMNVETFKLICNNDNTSIDIKVNNASDGLVDLMYDTIRCIITEIDYITNIHHLDAGISETFLNWVTRQTVIPILSKNKLVYLLLTWMNDYSGLNVYEKSIILCGMNITLNKKSKIIYDLMGETFGAKEFMKSILLKELIHSGIMPTHTILIMEMLRGIDHNIGINDISREHCGATKVLDDFKYLKYFIMLGPESFNQRQGLYNTGRVQFKYDTTPEDIIDIITKIYDRVDNNFSNEHVNTIIRWYQLSDTVNNDKVKVFNSICEYVESCYVKGMFTYSNQPNSVFNDVLDKTIFCPGMNVANRAFIDKTIFGHTNATLSNLFEITNAFERASVVRSIYDITEILSSSLVFVYDNNLGGYFGPVVSRIMKISSVSINDVMHYVDRIVTDDVSPAYNRMIKTISDWWGSNDNNVRILCNYWLLHEIYKMSGERAIVNTVIINSCCDTITHYCKRKMQ